ncbi:hypothetical protein HYC85_006733 [Camellia sinensis]|uniref:ATP phosphoribosyltransferase n=1 Tax=Camellia sinensis TaxID=4442 RepID=A0A7J7HN48_CAMSI|nr:hypothetical protein HYC85_006733 [Camellia sinensis]
MKSLFPKLSFKFRNTTSEIERAAILALGDSPADTWEKPLIRRTLSLSKLFTPKMKRTSSLPVTPIAHSNPESMHGGNTIDDYVVSLLTENGNTKDDLRLATDDALFTQNTEQQVQGMLNLIDLAGSERLSRSNWGPTERDSVCRLNLENVNHVVLRNPGHAKLSNLEVWFQWPKDIVRKLVSRDLDLGIVGLDAVSEYGQGNEDLILVHDALEFGDCRLSLAISHCSPLTQYSGMLIIPKYGIFENVNSMKELTQMRQWTPEKPLRVATGFTYLGPKFMKENGVKHVTFSTADGALEAAPAMGIAEAFVDLVSRGTTLRENNLKEIEGGVILQSQAVLVASRKSLTQRKGVTANMRGSSQEEVAERILSQTSLSGLQGPTISPIFCKRDGRVAADYYAIVICVPKKLLYKSIQQLRAEALKKRHEESLEPGAIPLTQEQLSIEIFGKNKLQPRTW